MGPKSVRRLFYWLGISFLLGFPWASAQNLPWQASEYFELKGGLNDGYDATAIAPDEASDLSNVVLTNSGAIKKRSGFTQINSTQVATAAVFTGLAQYTQANGTRFLVAAISNGSTDTIQKMDYGTGTAGPDGTWDNITGSISLAFADDQLADFATAQGNVIIEDGNGSTPPYVWTGSGNIAALSGNPPNAKIVEFHKNMVWLAGNDSTPSRLNFSNIGDQTIWTSTDFLTVESNDGQQIRALKSALNCLYIFKDASIWRACGSDRDNLQLEQMVNGVGTLSNQSVQLVNNVFFFVNNRGEVSSYDGGIAVRTISPKIQGTLTNLNLNRFGKAVSAAFNDGSGIENYYISMSSSGSGTHDTILQFNTLHGAWLKFSGVNANAMTVYEIGSTQKAIAFGDYAGRANRYPNGVSDAGSAINAYYQSGQLHFPELPHEKIFRLVRLFLNQTGSYTVNFQANVDFQSTGPTTSVSLASSGSVWDVARWDYASYGDLNTTIGRIEVNLKGDFFQWKLSDNSANPAFTLRGMQIWVEPTERVGGS